LNDSLLRLCGLQDSIFVPRGTSSREKQTWATMRPVGIFTPMGIEHMKYGK
jgi:hypothetical protein